MTDQRNYGDPAMIPKILRHLSSLLNHALLRFRPRTRIHTRSAWQSEFLFLTCRPSDRANAGSPMTREPFERPTQKSEIPFR